MRIFSGIRPTGELHIGNYLGAIKSWLTLQKDNEAVFCIVDLHALTTPYKPEELRKNILNTAVAYLAAGLNPEKCILFVQSQVKEHTELSWLLETITPLGELKRMTQYKDKSKKHPDYVNAGLLDYPVLMASDILLYQTDMVPIGKDQEQHVEFTRTVARRFNQTFGQTFKEPQSYIPKLGAKIMSLSDPKKKMSKTDDLKGCITLFEQPEAIREKIAKAVTDPGKTIAFNVTKKPGISNLLTIHSLLSEKPIKQLEAEFKGRSYAELKKEVAEILVDKLEPFRRKQKELLSREVYVQEILLRGSRKAQLIAQSTMTDVRKKMGLA